MSFYFAEIKNINDETIILDGAEHRHLSKVMRAKKGEMITVTDGAGMAYDCFIARIGRAETELGIVNRSRERGEPSRTVTLAVGISTSSKFDVILHMCCEIGVSAFAPLLTEKGKVKLEDEERQRRKLTRWREALKASIKQCERSRLPEIAPPQQLADFLTRQRESRNLRVIAHPAVTEAQSTEARTALRESASPLTLLVGPEAGFSDAEFQLAVRCGFLPLTVGERTLRAETAAPALAALALLGRD